MSDSDDDVPLGTLHVRRPNWLPEGPGERVPGCPQSCAPEGWHEEQVPARGRAAGSLAGAGGQGSPEREALLARGPHAPVPCGPAAASWAR